MIPAIDPATVGFDVDFADYLVVASRAGFRALEFSIEHVRQFVNRYTIDRLLSLAHEHQIELAQFTCGTGVPSNLSVSTNEFECGVRRWQENCALAASFGCRRASILVNSAKGNGFEERGVTLSGQELRRRLHLLCDIACRQGVHVSVEFVDAEMIEQTGAIWSDIRAPNFGILLDTYGLHKVHDPVQFVTKLPPGAITWLHVADACGEDQLRPASISVTKPPRVLPGDGQLPLYKIIQAVRQNGYAGHMSVEVYGSILMEELSFAQRAKHAADSLFCGKFDTFFHR